MPSRCDSAKISAGDLGLASEAIAWRRVATQGKGRGQGLAMDLRCHLMHQQRSGVQDQGSARLAPLGLG
jgi:hypothetical protein